MNILFVGNSYLYAGEGGRDFSPFGQFISMSQAAGIDGQIDSSFRGAAALETHWFDTEGDQARPMIESGTYDVVIFQVYFRDTPHRTTGHSSQTYGQYADLFADLVDQNGGSSVFFGLWAPDQFISASAGDSFTEDYHQLALSAAERNGEAYAPGGLAYAEAWAQLTASAGDDGQTAEALLTYDSVHGTQLGAYLAATVLFITIHGELPPESYLPPNVSAADAAFAREIAWDIVSAEGIAVDGVLTPPEMSEGEISGCFFVDANGDAEKTGEEGVEGVTVSLFDEAGDRIATTQTDASGAYSFAGLAAGTYQVLFDQSDAGTFLTSTATLADGRGSDVVRINANGDGRTDGIEITGSETIRGIDAGITPPPPPAPEPTPEPEPEPTPQPEPEPQGPDTTIEGTTENDRIFGANGDDVINGGSGNDRISAKDGDDFIDGGSGADTIFGRDGNDTMVFDSEDRFDGGSGDDSFIFNGSADIRGNAIRSVETFDLTQDAGATVLKLTHREVAQARDSDLVIKATAEDRVELDTDFSVVLTGQTTQDGEVYDVYRIGSSDWANDVLIDQDATVQII